MNDCKGTTKLAASAYAAFFFTLVACATPRIAIAESAEGSFGYLIITVSTPVFEGKRDKEYLGLDLKICRQAGNDSVTLRTSANNWMSGDKNDFSDANEAGMVVVKSLPSGSWEVCSYTATDTLGKIFVPQGTALSDMFTPKDFSIPFAIAQGRATYIGDFKAVGTTTKSLLGLTVPAGPRWVISNQSARDIPIAQKRYPGLQSIDMAVPDVDKLNDPRFSNHDAAGDGKAATTEAAKPLTPAADNAKTPAASAPQQ
jgi:hypothetical protein